MSEETNENYDFPVASLDDLLGVDDKREGYVNLPEWNMRVVVRSIPKTEQIQIRKMSTRSGKLDTDELERNLLLRGLVEPKLNRDTIDRLYEKSSGLVDRILGGVLKISGVDGDVEAIAASDFR